MTHTNYKAIMGGVKHLGNQPNSMGGRFVGIVLDVNFDLPANLSTGEVGVIQCRTLGIQVADKAFSLNGHRIPNILEPHPANLSEWMIDLAFVPENVLVPGQNTLRIGYEQGNYADDFLVDNIVLWYQAFAPQAQPIPPAPRGGQPRGGRPPGV